MTGISRHKKFNNRKDPIAPEDALQTGSADRNIRMNSCIRVVPQPVPFYIERTKKSNVCCTGIRVRITFLYFHNTA